MPVYITYFIQILLVIHVLKTGRNRYWIWLLLFVPLIGGIAYLVIEILPEFSGSIHGQRTMRGVRKAIDPGADLRHHAAAWEQSPNADNARRYAAVLMDQGQYSQADEVLEQALSGFFNTEPNLLLLKARSRFESGDSPAAIETLELLQHENPEFRSPEGHLLYARSLEAGDRLDEALAEYQSVGSYFPGAEARFRHARALAGAGRGDEAIEVYEALLTDADLAPPHFQKSQKKWLGRARDELRQLQS